MSFEIGYKSYVDEQIAKVEASAGLPKYATASAFPLTGNADGNLGVALDTGDIYEWNATQNAWVSYLTKAQADSLYSGAFANHTILQAIGQDTGTGKLTYNGSLVTDITKALADATYSPIFANAASLSLLTQDTGGNPEFNGSPMLSKSVADSTYSPIFANSTVLSNLADAAGILSYKGSNMLTKSNADTLYSPTLSNYSVITGITKDASNNLVWGGSALMTKLASDGRYAPAFTNDSVLRNIGDVSGKVYYNGTQILYKQDADSTYQAALGNILTVQKLGNDGNGNLQYNGVTVQSNLANSAILAKITASGAESSFDLSTIESNASQVANKQNTLANATILAKITQSGNEASIDLSQIAANATAIGNKQNTLANANVLAKITQSGAESSIDLSAITTNTTAIGNKWNTPTNASVLAKITQSGLESSFDLSMLLKQSNADLRYQAIQTTSNPYLTMNDVASASVDQNVFGPMGTTSANYNIVSGSNTNLTDGNDATSVTINGSGAKPMYTINYSKTVWTKKVTLNFDGSCTGTVYFFKAGTQIGTTAFTATNGSQDILPPIPANTSALAIDKIEVEWNNTASNITVYTIKTVGTTNEPTITKTYADTLYASTGGGSVTKTQPAGTPVTMSQYQEVQFTVPAMTNYNGEINVFEQVNNISAIQGDGLHQLASSAGVGAKMAFTNNFTFEFSMKTAASATAEVSKYLMCFGANKAAILMGYVSGVLEFYSVGFSGTSPRNSLSQITIPTDGAWHTYTWSYDGSGAVTGTAGKFDTYRDGVLINTQTITFSLPIVAADLLYIFGGNSANTYLTASTQIDEVKFLNQASTSAQVNARLTTVPTGNPNLVGYYNFDENVAGATVKDQSNYGTAVNLTNTGTLPYVTAGIPSVTGYPEKCSTGKYTDWNSLFGVRYYNETTVGVRKNSPGSSQVWITAI